ncbi:SIR2 family NAD-dependent protein deacylase [Alicyclobacillus sacchari]|nr:Sir2 family NAD-dependent protein deacetylase [Alicyclobacillus sacchari]
MARFHAKELVAITGAGISVESGLPVGTGTVLGVSLGDFFRRDIWLSDARAAFDAYRHMLSEWRSASPNAAHIALARAGVRIVTQNIDGLHRDAGSESVIELHGNLRELRCDACRSRFTAMLAFAEQIPLCPTCGGKLLPGIVFEGEQVRHIARATEWVADSRCVLVVGTEMNMDPVRRLREVGVRAGADIIWVLDDAEAWVCALVKACC